MLSPRCNSYGSVGSWSLPRLVKDLPRLIHFADVAFAAEVAGVRGGRRPLTSYRWWTMMSLFVSVGCDCHAFKHGRHSRIIHLRLSHELLRLAADRIRSGKSTRVKKCAHPTWFDFTKRQGGRRHERLFNLLLDEKWNVQKKKKKAKDPNSRWCSSCKFYLEQPHHPRTPELIDTCNTPDSVDSHKLSNYMTRSS